LKADSVILGFAILLTVFPLNAFALEKFTWEHRLLLAFAPSNDDELLKRQRQLLAGRNSGIKERHMRIIDVSSAGPVKVDGHVDQDLETSQLRKGYNVPSDRFSVILIGKDGGEKGRWIEPVRPDKIFDMIDAMPMRQDEMQTDK
jgi:hypothetical protein